MYLGLPVVKGQIRMKLNRHHFCFSEKKKKNLARLISGNLYKDYSKCVSLTVAETKGNI